MAGLVIGNMKTMSMLGAWVTVLGRFLDAVLPHLTTLLRIEIKQSFLQGIDDVMSLMDDVPLSANYHSTLLELELTNIILSALDKGSPPRN